MMKKIYLARHGDIGLGRDKRYIGITDLSLSDKGREQANYLKEQLQDEPLDHIYCSNLARTQETAEIIASPHRISLSVLPDLHELNMGDWDGKLFTDIKQEFPREYRKRGEDIVNYRPPKGESFFDCFQRVIPVFDSILRSHKKNSLIVGHAGVNRIILCHALHKPLPELFQIEQGYGCLNVLTHDEKGIRLGSYHINQKYNFQVR
ncbi:MAG: alpha-ribazole phosphatase [Desulfosporosinus sp.]|nr:alpha-ribazole phosphatase [Desulfosporosinus sp.]